MKSTILLRRIHIAMIAIILGTLFVLTCQFKSADAEIQRFEKRDAFYVPYEIIKKLDYFYIPRCMEKYLKDRIPFREQLITWRNVLLHQFWNTSGYDTVVFGKDNWLFNNYDDLLNPDDVRGGKSRPFTEEQLQKHAAYFLDVNEWLSYKNIPYALVIVPTKQSVYPEFLPEHSNQFVEWSRADEMINYLRSNSNIKIIDLRDEVKRRKNEKPVFMKLDTHWNWFAALHGYEVMIAKLQEVLPGIKSFDSDYLEQSILHDPDLGLMSRIPKYLKEPAVEYLRLNAPYPNVVTGQKGSLHSTTDDPSAPRALVYHDSMFMNLLAYFADHFSVADYKQQNNFVAADVVATRPDIVVQEMSEGVLACKLMKHNVGGELQRRRFERGTELVRFEPTDGFQLTDCHWVDGNQLVATSKDPRIEFFCPTNSGTNQRKLRISIKAEKSSALELFYAKNNEAFVSQLSESLAVKKGQNELYVAIPDDVTRIRLDPCNYAGAISLNFEIRDCAESKLASVPAETPSPPSVSSRFHKAEKLVSFPSAQPGDSEQLQNCYLDKKSGTLICTNEDPQVSFNVGDIHTDRTLRFCAEVDEPTYFQLFYKHGFEEFSEVNSIHARLYKGKNELFITLPRDVVQFRIDPCASKGKCQISFQIAAVANTDVQIAQKNTPSLEADKTY